MSGVRSELTRYLPENWNAIVDGEVDGKNSVPYRLDKENSRFGMSRAARRVARTVFLGSAPSARGQSVGWKCTISRRRKSITRSWIRSPVREMSFWSKPPEA